MTRLLALVDAGEVQAIIIAKLDRLTRSVKDLCTLLERFERRGVALVSVAESLDTGSAAGRLVLNIMTAVSQWERKAISERTRRDEPQAHQRRTCWQHPVRLPALRRREARRTRTPPSRPCSTKSAACVKAVRRCAELRQRSITARFELVVDRHGGWSMWRESSSRVKSARTRAH